MTPQEQIEEQYGHEKLIGVCRVSGDWIEVESTDEPCPHPGCDCGLAFFRSIRFDSPQISEGMVEAGAVAMMGLSYQRWDSLDEMAKNISRIKARACLSAALNQKGDSNE